MIDYHYKAFVENDDCGAKRAVVFRTNKFLSFEQVQKKIAKYIPTQMCARCGKHHDNRTYSLLDLECNEEVVFH